MEIMPNNNDDNEVREDNNEVREVDPERRVDDNERRDDANEIREADNEIQPNAIEIRDVWAANLEEEILLISESVGDFSYVAIDTEFPGTLFQPDRDYHSLKANVDMLKLIQLGLAISDRNGNLPLFERRRVVWQFNFREFNPDVDLQNRFSVAFLRDHGMDFGRNNRDGIDSHQFGELIMGSGILMNDEVEWITFHGRADIGYLIKLLRGGTYLPDKKKDFLVLTKAYLPRLYDIKQLVENIPGLFGGLGRIAQALRVERIGNAHNAGSDSLLTLRTFIRLIETMGDALNLDHHVGVLYGI